MDYKGPTDFRFNQINTDVVFISDVHYSVVNLDLSDAAVKAALDYCFKHRYRLIITGDLTDGKAQMNARVVNRMIETFRSARVPVYVLYGNHDKVNEKSEDHALEFLKPYITVYDTAQYSEELGAYVIPYQHDVGKMHRLLSVVPRGYRVYCHQGIDGANLGDYNNDKTAISRDRFAGIRVISGHYHQHQHIRCPDGGLFSYVGNPFTMSFGEAKDGHKGFCVLDDYWKLTQHPLDLRKHIVVNRTTADLFNTVVPCNPDDLVWIKVTGPESELALLDKDVIADKLLPMRNYRLDKIPTDTGGKSEKPVSDSCQDMLDGLIAGLPETVEQKKYLSSLWRDLSDEEI